MSLIICERCLITRVNCEFHDKVSSIILLFEHIVKGFEPFTFIISVGLFALLVLTDYLLSTLERKETHMNGEHSFTKSNLKVFFLIGIGTQCAAFIHE